MAAADRDRIDELVAQWDEQRPGMPLPAMATWARLGHLTKVAGPLIDGVFARHGLNRGEFDVLATLRRSGEPFELSPGSLAAASLVSTGAMTNRLDRLERAGLIVRRPDERDRRGLAVRLTDEGLRRVDAAVAEHVANEERLLSSLTKAERTQLDALLRKLLRGLGEA